MRTTLALIGNRVATDADYPKGQKKVGARLFLSVDFEIADSVQGDATKFSAITDMDTGRRMALHTFSEYEADQITRACRRYANTHPLQPEPKA